MDVEVLRSELLKFSKEELVTELLAALVELAKAPCSGCDGHECDNGCQYPGVANQRQITRK